MSLENNESINPEQVVNGLVEDAPAERSASDDTESASAAAAGSAYDTSSYSVSRFLVWGSINPVSSDSSKQNQQSATYR